MTTLTYDNGGYSGSTRVRAQDGHALKFVTGQFAFDSSYPTGGESISDIFAQFSECLGVMFDQPVQAGTQVGKNVGVDYTNKKVLVYDNGADFLQITNTTIAAASDAAALPQATINVASTTGFAAAGNITVVTDGAPALVAYTSVTALTFAGCTGGTGTINTGNAVTPDQSALTGLRFIAWGH